MLIGTKRLDEEKVAVLIADIRRKKELTELSEEFVREHVLEFLEQEHKAASMLLQQFNPRSAVYKKLIKDVRARLRRVYGLFRLEEELKRRRQLVDKLVTTGSKPESKDRKELLDMILATHSSTRERIPFYDQLYTKIVSITGKPTSIIDLGCGINPFSFPYLKLKKVAYYAYDISNEEIESLNTYFHRLHTENKLFTGTAHVLNILQWLKLRKLPQADVCFLFKMTDVLDRGRGHKASEAVITGVPARYVVVSFPTLTMSGRKMNAPRRKWIELMCKRLGYVFTLLTFSNEIFYVIEKKT